MTAFVYNSPHMFEIFVIDCWSIPFGAITKDVCPTALRTDPVSETSGPTYFSLINGHLFSHKTRLIRKGRGLRGGHTCCLKETTVFQDYLTIYYAYMYTIVMAGGPVFLLILINSAIVIAMKR